MRVFQDLQDSRVLRGIQDLKEKKVKHRSLREKWVPQGTLGSEGILEEGAWTEFLELLGSKDHQDPKVNRP